MGNESLISLSREVAHDLKESALPLRELERLSITLRATRLPVNFAV